ncbi:MAG: hypothetical protein ACOX3S_13255 [Anaerolineae bacterium]|jgi:hypothetical protein
MKTNRSADSMGAGIFLIGLGVVFLLRNRIDFLPWVLAVIAISRVPAALASDRGWEAWQAPFWLLGLAILFGTGLLWPGILVLVGLSMLLRAAAAKAKAPAAELSDEPVTVAPLPSAMRGQAAQAPDLGDEPTHATPAGAAETVSEYVADEGGTRPLSSADVHALERELAHEVEGAAPAGGAPAGEPLTDGPALEPETGAETDQSDAPCADDATT